MELTSLDEHMALSIMSWILGNPASRKNCNPLFAFSSFSFGKVIRECSLLNKASVSCWMHLCTIDWLTDVADRRPLWLYKNRWKHRIWKWLWPSAAVWKKVLQQMSCLVTPHHLLTHVLWILFNGSKEPLHVSAENARVLSGFSTNPEWHQWHFSSMIYVASIECMGFEGPC